MPDHRRTNRPDTAPITRPRRLPRDEPRKALVDTVVPLSRQDIMRNLKIATIIAFVVWAASLDSSSSWVDITVVCGLGVGLVGVGVFVKRAGRKGRKKVQGKSPAFKEPEPPIIVPDHILPRGECGTGRIMNTVDLKKRLEEVQDQEKAEKEKARKARKRERQAAKKEARGDEVVEGDGEE